MNSQNALCALSEKKRCARRAIAAPPRETNLSEQLSTAKKRQRFGIAQALIGNPQLIIVDEPTAGLDPGERNRFYNLLGENVIVILSTHIVEDVKELCSNMVIIHQGRLLYHGTPQAAMERLGGKIWQEGRMGDLQQSVSADLFQAGGRATGNSCVAG